jgi:hypothetical protein
VGPSTSMREVQKSIGMAPISLTKPWVNAEVDGAFVLKLEGSCRLVPLRGLPPGGLPVLLRGVLSPSIEEYDRDIKNLISDIYGTSRKSPLGPSPPLALERCPGTELSAAAEAIVRFVVETSKTGMSMDPRCLPMIAAGLGDDDIRPCRRRTAWTRYVASVCEYRLQTYGFSYGGAGKRAVRVDGQIF